MSFGDIKGQDSAVSFLTRSAESGRISHAYIFAGPAGVGRKLAAMNFAKMLNCLAASGARPCDECASCARINGANHPDVFVLKPEKEGASLGIDLVRDVIKNIGLKPYEARTKIYIIDDAAYLTNEAQNALLKTVEEPPSDSVIIFIAENPEDLFPTIESRAQIVKFFPMMSAQIAEVLKNIHKLDDPSSKVLSKIADGSLGSALKLNGEKFFNKRGAILDALAGGTFFDSDFEGLTRPDMRLYLEMTLAWYRDVLVAKTAGHAARPLLVNVDRAEMIEAEAARLSFDYLDNAIKKILTTVSFLDYNVNTKLAMSVLGTEIAR